MRQFVPLLLAASVHAIDLAQPGWNTIGGMGMNEMNDYMGPGGMEGLVDDYWPTDGYWNGTNSTNSTDYGYGNDDYMMPPLSQLFVDEEGMAWDVDIIDMNTHELIFDSVVIDVEAAMDSGPSSSSGSTSSEGSSGSGSEDEPFWIEVKEVWNYDEDSQEPVERDIMLLIGNVDCGGSEDCFGSSSDDNDDGTEEGKGGWTEEEEKEMGYEEGDDCYMSNPGSYTDMLNYFFFGMSNYEFTECVGTDRFTAYALRQVSCQEFNDDVVVPA